MKAIKRGNKLIIDAKEYKAGMKEEMEHLDVTGGGSVATQKIVMAHLKENPKYYTKLKKAIKVKTKEVESEDDDEEETEENEDSKN